MDLIVLLTLVFVVVFVVAWSISPALRAWIEHPKYRFQENLRSYDKTTRIRFLDRRRTR
jgi:hypothetical protein